MRSMWRKELDYILKKAVNMKRLLKKFWIS